jgi:hypothetical protein
MYSDKYPAYNKSSLPFGLLSLSIVSQPVVIPAFPTLFSSAGVYSNGPCIFITARYSGIGVFIVPESGAKGT